MGEILKATFKRPCGQDGIRPNSKMGQGPKATKSKTDYPKDGKKADGSP